MTVARNRTDLVDALSAGVASLVTTDAWRRHLEYQSTFHSYSFSNVMLIASQRPGATLVAGFHAWRKRGRSVCRGEKAIWILAPILARRRDAAGQDEERVPVGFKHVPVFDVAQTDGEPVPEVCRRLSGGDAAGVYGALGGVADELGFSVCECRLPGGRNGDCNVAERRIRIEVANEPAQKVKTFVHELAHALLHGSGDDRALAELEAESVAFVVCRAVGIDSGEYSFGYVATWAGSPADALGRIRASGDRIQGAADRILGSLEAPLEAAAGAGVEAAA